MATLPIAFIGQCHTVGYPGVPPEAAFPAVCKRVLEDARPDANVTVVLEPYYHPFELERAVDAVLRHTPRVVVIEVVGWLAVAGTAAVDLRRLPPTVTSVYDRIRHFRHVSQSVVKSIPHGPELVYRVQTAATSVSAKVLRPLLRRYPRPSVADYSAALNNALAKLAEHEDITIVIQGPGAPNPDLQMRGLPRDVHDRYHAVNEMARHAADEHGAVYVDRWDTVSSRFYNDGSVRPTAVAHRAWGHLLASHLLANEIV